MSKIKYALLLAAFYSGNINAQDDYPKSNPDAKAAVLEIKSDPKAFSGQSSAIIYDVQSRTTTPIVLNEDNPILKNIGEPPINGARFDIPVNPADPSFPRIEFNNGSTFCSSTVIGPRHLLTAGHCVFDGGSFRQNAVAYPGYSQGLPSPTFGGYVARRLIAFSGWTQGRDTAHDIALVELDRDLPAGVQRYVIKNGAPNCSISNGFDRKFYLEGSKDQLINQSMSYIGCKRNQLFFYAGNGHGSSGSSGVAQGTKEILAVRSNSDNVVGYDAWITPAKRCFLTSRAGTPNC